MVALHFVTAATPTQTISIREKELARAKARSHASKISHKRAGRGDQCQRRKDNPLCSTNILDRGKLTPEEQDRLSSLVAPSCIKTGMLDPFIQLPTSLNMHDRQMLHLYLSIMPRVEYGLKPNPSFDPVRDYGIPVIANDMTFLQLYLLIAEIAVGAPRAMVLTRRAMIYSNLRKIVDSEESQNLISTLVLLAGLASAENRMGNVELAHKHYTAATQWVNMRGGLKTLHNMYFAHGLGIVRCFVQQGLTLFSDESSIIQGLDRLKLDKGKEIDRQLWKYIRVDPDQRLRMANFHMLNMIMSDEPTGFMKELTEMTTGSGEHLTPSAIQFMISTCVFRVRRWHGPKPALRSWETIEFVELVMYASREHREKLGNTMHGWLTGSNHSDFDMSELKADILIGWQKAQKERKEGARNL